MITECIAATPNWTERTVRMKFALGGLMLFPVYFRAAVYTGTPLDLPADPDSRPPKPASASRDIRADLINSHPVARHIPRISFRRGSIRYSASQYRRFQIGLEGTFEDYMARFSHARRNKLQRMVRRWARHCGGRIDWREYKRPGEMAEFHRLAREISHRTYQEKLCDAGMPDGEEFVAELRERAQNDEVRGYILFDGDKPVSFQYCSVWQDLLTGERQGYDPDYRALTPGHVLFLLTLEHNFASHEFRCFDLGRGEFDYKETFSTGYVRCADIYYFRPSLANAALVLAHTALDCSWRAAAWVLNGLRLRKPLRRMVRIYYGSSRE